jgi:hypothetical protein
VGRLVDAVGLLAGEVDALVGSFVGEPELHHPLRGRIRGTGRFEEYVAEENAWLRRRNVSVENIEYVVAERHGLAEVVLHLDGEIGRVGLPVAVVNQKAPGGRISELRMYFSGWPLTGRHAHRPPLLQPDPRLRESDVVEEYQLALSAGAVDEIVATFESDGYAREPAGGEYIHKGLDELRRFYELCFSNGRGSHRQTLSARHGLARGRRPSGRAATRPGGRGDRRVQRLLLDPDPGRGPPTTTVIAGRVAQAHASHARGRWFETSRAHPYSLECF